MATTDSTDIVEDEHHPRRSLYFPISGIAAISLTALLMNGSADEREASARHAISTSYAAPVRSHTASALVIVGKAGFNVSYETFTEDLLADGTTRSNQIVCRFVPKSYQAQNTFPRLLQSVNQNTTLATPRGHHHVSSAYAKDEIHEIPRAIAATCDSTRVSLEGKLNKTALKDSLFKHQDTFLFK